ncbi:MAG: hypothetical protein K0Q50_2757 [Vampirovibrio sp.]|nr:hypothetical protein [Vampirovibrio sp.]
MQPFPTACATPTISNDMQPALPRGREYPAAGNRMNENLRLQQDDSDSLQANRAMPTLTLKALVDCVLERGESSAMV